jgi:hypothetical protein
MVGVKGLEPSTSRSQTARASQLRHTPELPVAIAAVLAWPRVEDYVQTRAE